MATNVPEAVANDLNPGPIEAEDAATSDWDEESIASSTQSLTESILDHIYQGGRRYHRKSKEQYFLPSDDTEQDRLDMIHEMHLELLNRRLTMTKLTEDPGNVLDCGCGTGIWALDFGNEHPGSQVVGLDLAPIQPGWTAPNVKFELDDLEKEWTYAPNHFNFIHSRHLAVSIKDWPKYLRQMYYHAAPGANIEVVEYNMDKMLCDDGTMPENSAYHTYTDALQSSLQKLGIDGGYHATDYKRMMQEAGFVDVNIYAFKIPIGIWTRNPKLKKIGFIFYHIATTGAEAHAYSLLTNVGGYSVENARKIIDDVVATFKRAKEHVYYMEYYITGRKPK